MERDGTGWNAAMIEHSNDVSDQKSAWVDKSMFISTDTRSSI